MNTLYTQVDETQQSCSFQLHRHGLNANKPTRLGTIDVVAFGSMVGFAFAYALQV